MLVVLAAQPDQVVLVERLRHLERLGRLVRRVQLEVTVRYRRSQSKASRYRWLLLQVVSVVVRQAVVLLPVCPVVLDLVAARDCTRELRWVARVVLRLLVVRAELVVPDIVAVLVQMVGRVVMLVTAVVARVVRMARMVRPRRRRVRVRRVLVSWSRMDRLGRRVRRGRLVRPDR